MIYGLYLSAQGADVQSTRLDVIANNLANASTGSFKRDLAIFQAHRPFDVENGMSHEVPGDLNQSTGGISLSDVTTDFSDGPMIATGGKHDLAISGPGFLRVTDGQQEFLTRNGRLAVNRLGELVTHESGYNVLAAGGARITLQGSGDIEITSDGTIYELDANGVRSLGPKFDLVVPDSFDNLEKVGDSLYRTTGNLLPAGDEVRVRQGYVEGSGTRPVLEMMQMIEATRAFEANVNMIKFQDESLARLLQSASRR